MGCTLYVTDLDGTLINRDQKITDFTAKTINTLVSRGMCFSYATARSNVTASKITQSIFADIPVIVYNGAFILDHLTNNILFSNYFSSNDSSNILDLLIRHKVYPIVYSYDDGVEKFRYLSDHVNSATKLFLDSRKGDVRDTPVVDIEVLSADDIFYFTCIDRPDKLYPIYKEVVKKYSCVYHKDIYSGDQWLEIMPFRVNKANAVLELKKILGCDKIISFGDGKNDIPMFQISDECYAVENADTGLKAIATGIIESNDSDGVAKWLQENVRI